MTLKPANEIFQVHFIPDDIVISVENGANLMETAIKAGVHINNSCGGKGVCRNCRIKIEQGTVDHAGDDWHSEHGYESGIRLACQSSISSNLTVSIPIESRVDQATQAAEREKPADALLLPWRFNPPLKKYYLELTPPTRNDNASDLFRLMGGLENQHKLKNLQINIDVIRKLSRVMREKDWRVTVSILTDSAMPRNGNHHSLVITNIEPGDMCRIHLALAIDIGTTTICSQLLDLNHGKILAETITFNKQRANGDDVITRIVHSQKTDGLMELQTAVITSINESIDSLLTDTQVNRQDIGYVTIAGNTTMQMLLVGLDPKFIRLSPYITTANFLPLVKASDLGIKLAGFVYIFPFPSVSSYIGGDIVSGIVAAGVHQSNKLTLYMDMGTNGEIVIGNSDWMVTASCSAGPAFEGSGIRHGMVAVKGAIEEFSIDRISLEPVIKTIGNVLPKGICGSGLINIIADLLTAGVIDQNGKYNTTLTSPRIRQGSDGFEYVLVWKPETQIGRDIVITEVDINNLIRAKAAMYAGCHTLAHKVNVSCSDFEQVILAGNFGSSLNIEKAIITGLLPDIPREKFSFIGNGSLSGARLASFSVEILDDCLRVAQMMTNIELGDDNEFIHNYMAALFLPHTDGKAFPSVVTKPG